MELTLDKYLINIDHKCTRSVIRELCGTRDGCNTQFV